MRVVQGQSIARRLLPVGGVTRSALLFPKLANLSHVVTAANVCHCLVLAKPATRLPYCSLKAVARAGNVYHVAESILRTVSGSLRCTEHLLTLAAIQNCSALFPKKNLRIFLTTS